MAANAATDQEALLASRGQGATDNIIGHPRLSKAMRASVIDLGYNSLKMVSYEVRPDGSFRVYRPARRTDAHRRGPQPHRLPGKRTHRQDDTRAQALQRGKQALEGRQDTRHRHLRSKGGRKRLRVCQRGRVGHGAALPRALGKGRGSLLLRRRRQGGRNYPTSSSSTSVEARWSSPALRVLG